MRSLDGKLRVTDAADTETLLRLVQSIPSPKAEPFKQWLARVGAERLEEVPDSDLLAGMTPEQRAIFLRGQMADRNLSLAEAAATVGVATSRDFAFFQEHGYRGLDGGEAARDIAARMGLKRGQSIWIVDHPARNLTERIALYNARRYPDGWLVRHLARIFREAGLVDVRVAGFVDVQDAPESHLYGGAERAAQTAAEAGAISAEEVARWIGQLRELAEQGSFFASQNYYSCVGTRPVE